MIRFNAMMNANVRKFLDLVSTGEISILGYNGRVSKTIFLSEHTLFTAVFLLGIAGDFLYNFTSPKFFIKVLFFQKDRSFCQFASPLFIGFVYARDTKKRRK